MLNKITIFVALIVYFASNNFINASESCEFYPNGMNYKHTTVGGILNFRIMENKKCKSCKNKITYKNRVVCKINGYKHIRLMCKSCYRKKYYNTPYRKEYVKKYNKKYQETYQSKFCEIKKRARKINHKFDISLEDIKLLPLKCFYTGLPLTLKCNKPNTFSVDRIDSNRGYTKDNIVSCCWVVNRMKSNMSIRQFKKLCTEIITNYNKPINKPTYCNDIKWLNYKIKQHQWGKIAKTLGLNIDVDYLKTIPFHCYYTHKKLFIKNKYSNGDGRNISIERIDNTKGYIKGNVAFCILFVNRMKNSLSMNEFIKYCKLINKNI